VATEVGGDTRSVEALERRGQRGRRERVALFVLVAGLVVTAGSAVLSLVPVRVGLNDGTSFRCGIPITRLTNPAPASRWTLQTLVLVSRHRLDPHGPALTARCPSAIDHRLRYVVATLGVGVLAAGAGALLLRKRPRRRPGPVGTVAVRPRDPAAAGGTVRPRGVSLEYIPALDGFRGVAVIAVLAFHAGLSHSRGGFLGVDAFFVLSGYLITSLLVAEWRRMGTISLRTFWARRARRLLPAILLVVAAVTIYWAFFGPAAQRPALRFDALATLGYVANWRFIFSKAAYFAPFSASSPLRHLWSLAVEEQFYLVWPVLVLLVLRRWSVRALAVVTALLAAASVVVMVAVYKPGSVSRAYYGTDARAHVLLIGALLALAVPHLLTRPAWRRAVGGLGVAGAAYVMWAFIEINGQGSFLYHGGSLLFAVAAAGVLATAVVVREGAVARVLALRPLRAVGRVSYGLYLWHWPVFLAVTHARTGLDDAPLLVARVAITALLTVLSYELVERPVRRGALGRRALVLAPLCLFLVTGISIRATFPVASPLPTTAQFAGLFGGSGPRPVGAVRVFVVGDSVAFTLAEGLKSGPDVQFDGHALLGCGLMRGEMKALGEHNGSPCPDSVAIWRNDVSRLRPAVLAVLVGRWEVRDRRIGGRWTHVGQPVFDTALAHRLDETVDMARRGGARVAFLTAPFYEEGEQPNGHAWPEDSPDRVLRFNALLREAAARHPRDVTVIDVNRLLCPHGHFERVVGGTAVRWRDGVHIAEGGAALVQPTLTRQVLELASSA
jgi:peptidoglycan/LPS O-acetylase OafA/YrhL